MKKKERADRTARANYEANKKKLGRTPVPRAASAAVAKKCGLCVVTFLPPSTESTWLNPRIPVPLQRIRAYPGSQTLSRTLSLVPFVADKRLPGPQKLHAPRTLRPRPPPSSRTSAKDAPLATLTRSRQEPLRICAKGSRQGG